nr:protein N-terminal glutamine amidohydrolase [Ipomoea batatas]
MAKNSSRVSVVAIVMVFAVMLYLGSSSSDKEARGLAEVDVISDDENKSCRQIRRAKGENRKDDNINQLGAVYLSTHPFLLVISCSDLVSFTKLIFDVVLTWPCLDCLLKAETFDALCVYFTCDCSEENVYLLCKKLCADGVANPDASDLFAVFISNEKKQACPLSLFLIFHFFISLDDSLSRLIVPLWNQKASHRADGVVLWDYHVICIQKKKDGNSSHLVWDLDSSLPFPSPLSSYIAETIRPSFPLFTEFKRSCRVVHGPIFLRSFASDRSHMKDTAGNWVAQPPPYEAIAAEDGISNNLNEYIEISSEDAAENLNADVVKAALAQKFGIVVAESLLEEFLSLVDD